MRIIKCQCGWKYDVDKRKDCPGCHAIHHGNELQGMKAQAGCVTTPSVFVSRGLPLSSIWNKLEPEQVAWAYVCVLSMHGNIWRLANVDEMWCASLINPDIKDVLSQWNMNWHETVSKYLISADAAWALSPIWRG